MLQSILSTEKVIWMVINIEKHEQQTTRLSNKQHGSFDIILQWWMSYDLSVSSLQIKIMRIDAFIPSFRAEDKRSFSLMT